jgi:GNAT superfamily N-acetyltransferase
MTNALVQKLRFEPATHDRWSDIELLFGSRGACGGCWCMTWRIPRKQFVAQRGEQNRSMLRDIVTEGREPGILAYHDERPIGWCAIAPREVYVSLARSRILAPVDDSPVWSVSCLFVTKPYRRKGVSVALLRASVRFARRHGAKIVEGYPQDLGKGVLPDAFVWTGIRGAFDQAGFQEVARRSPKRPIMRNSTGK